MSKNLQQVNASNSAAGMGATDLMYLAVGGATDAGITGLALGLAGLTNKGLLVANSSGNIAQVAVVNNGVLISSAAGVPSLLANSGVTNTIFQANAAGPPTWSTATYPATTTINQVLYSSAANTVTGLATVNNATFATDASGVPKVLSMAANGNILIGSGAGAPAVGTITQTANQVLVTNGVNTITLSAPQNLHTAATFQVGTLGIGAADNANATATVTATTAYNTLITGTQTAQVSNNQYALFINSTLAPTAQLTGIISGIAITPTITVPNVATPSIATACGEYIKVTVNGTAGKDISNCYGLFIDSTTVSSATLDAAYGLRVVQPVGNIVNCTAWFDVAVAIGDVLYAGTASLGVSSVNSINTQFTGTQTLLLGGANQYCQYVVPTFAPTLQVTGVIAAIYCVATITIPNVTNPAIAAAYGHYSFVQVNGTAGKVLTNCYSIYIDASNVQTATVTNNYGLYVKAPLAGTNKYTAYFDAGIGIGGVNLTSSTAALSITSTTQGFLPPSMTTTQKNAISGPASGLLLYDNTLNDIQYYNGSVWVSSAGVTSIAGTSNQITASAATGAVTLSLTTDTALPGNPSAATQASTDNSTRIATTAYVTTGINNAIAGVNPAVAVQAATTAAANTSTWTYANGAAGIGATFTGPINTVSTIDGFTFNAVNQRLLVKNDTQSPSGAFNGVYNLTALHTVGTGDVYTRALDYDMPSDINNTGAIPVVNGTVNALTSWLLTSSVNTVGTDPLTYTQFSRSPISVLTLALGGTNAALTASNGGVFYSTASAGAILAGTATANQLFLSGASTTPAWSTSTYPATNAVNTLLYASSANVMAALATANSSNLQTNSSGVPAWTALAPLNKILSSSSTSLTLDTTMQTVLLTSSSARAVAPPNANSVSTGYWYTVKDQSGTASTANITITPTGSNIDGAANIILASNYASVTFTSDGTNWYIT